MKGQDPRLKKIYKRLYNRFGPQGWWPGDTPFEVAVGAILTQNTAWSNVARAIRNLKDARCLTSNHLRDINKTRLSELIRPSGYFNIKAERLKAFLALLHKEYKGSMKGMGKENPLVLRGRLLGVKGIGPETADSILLYAFNYPVFVVDAYTRRILTRHRILSEKSNYEEIQDFFHKNLPHDAGLFNEYHALIVMVGKEYCKRRPICDGCPLKDIN
ncbi:MAG: endonuclease III domain-containing protein [Nitrospirae bacterium]|nr:endonuclease III domain-containing protein [Nitrospirota bacterium]